MRDHTNERTKTKTSPTGLQHGSRLDRMRRILWSGYAARLKNPTAVAVLAVLDNFTDADGEGRPTIEQVAAILGVTERTVKRAFADLEEAKIIETVSRGRPGVASVRRIRMKKWKPLPELRKGKGDARVPRAAVTGDICDQKGDARVTQRGTRVTSNGGRTRPPKEHDKKHEKSQTKTRVGLDLGSLEEDIELLAKKLEEKFHIAPKAAKRHAAAFLEENSWAISTGAAMIFASTEKKDVEDLHNPAGYVIDALRNPKKAAKNGLAKYLPSDFRAARRPEAATDAEGNIHPIAYEDDLIRPILRGDAPVKQKADDDDGGAELTEEDRFYDPIPPISDFAEGEVYEWVSRIDDRHVLRFAREGDGWRHRREYLTDAQRHELIMKGYIDD